MNLKEFRESMPILRATRARVASRLLADESPQKKDIDFLLHYLQKLSSLPERDGLRLFLEAEKPVALDIGYEIRESQKDDVYLSRDAGSFRKWWRGSHPQWEQEAESGSAALAGAKLDILVADRDGTINNYCARYWSSVQPVHAAVILSRFIRAYCTRAMVLTSAPLKGGGLVDVNVMPSDLCVYAGSKGREYSTPDGLCGHDTLLPDQEEKLLRLEEKLTRLLQLPHYGLFARIGSGMQKKFGQLTVAIQDIARSASPALSAQFKAEVEAAVWETDPEQKYFRLEDTGLDVEILLTVDESGPGGSLREFTKGDGLLFLSSRLKIPLTGEALICGDTWADLPMIKVAKNHGARVTAFFVTRDPALQEAVSASAEKACFFSAPDSLLMALM